jgi:hypothetical protein
LRRRARRSARYAVAIAAKAAHQRTEIYQLCGEVFWMLGHSRRADQWWQRAVACGREMHARPELARTQALLARTRADEAARAEALAVFRACALEWEVVQLEELRAERAA